MIHSTSSSDRTVRPENVTPAPAPSRTQGCGTDQFSSSQAASLRAALEQHPEVRPEVVERGRQLAADPGYPSADVLKQVASAILGAPDLTAE